MTLPNAADYCFVAEVEINGEWRTVELEIREHDEIAKGQYLAVWQKLCLALSKYHDLGRSPAPDWTNWKPGEWCEQRKGYEPRMKFVNTPTKHTQHILNCWPEVVSAVDPAKRVLYVEHLAAAPGNIDTDLWRKRFRFVGQSLFAYAVMVSLIHGYEGRLGLHATEEALGFYRRINHKFCKGKLFHPELQGIAGPTPRGQSERTKTYLETIEAASVSWLEGYRRG